MVNINLNGKAIWSYAIYRDCIDLRSPGNCISITDPDEIKTLKQWINEAKSFAKTRDEITSYLEYMIDIGQYEE